MNTLQTYAARVNERLAALVRCDDSALPSPGACPTLLSKSMDYSLSAGGKRLRPAMLLAAVELLGGDVEAALDFACAVEMIHTYSLIHDDLPGMDDDTLRRGRPTNHVVFGVGQAILAGDGLLSLAFETMLSAASKDASHAVGYIHAMREIATGCGVTGMVAGQVLDLECERSHLDSVYALEAIQYGKTACMFIHPLRAAVYLAGGDADDLDAFTAYGKAFGLLFQATDDLLDVTGTAEEVGKTLGKDAESGKLTCISAYGVRGTRARVERLHAEAIEALRPYDHRADFFRRLADDMVDRTR